MPPIRTMVIAAFVGALAFYALINFLGTFMLSNAQPIPPALQNFYKGLQLNNSLSGISVLSAQANATAAQLGNGNIVAGTGSVIGMISAFFVTLPNIIGGFVNFTAYELAFVGIPTSLAVGVAWGLLVAMIVLAIISAIMFFGV